MAKNNFLDVFIDVFNEEKEDTYEISEGILPMTPFIAYTALKKKVFNKLKNSKMHEYGKKAADLPKKAKAKAAIEVEKLRAAVGAQSGETVYKLKKEQLDIMADMYDKYGKELVDEIIEFRRKILAPYQLLKRKIKQSSTISSKDITGLSKEEFQNAVESGRKKILARGPEYFEKSKEIQQKINNINEQIEDLKRARKEFQGENPKVNYNIVNRVYREYDVAGGSFEGYSKEDLRKVYDDIMSNYRSLVKIAKADEMSPEQYEKAKKLMDKSKKLWAGKTIDLTKQEKDEFYKQGDFNTALGKYFFSREILKQLTNPQVSGIFKKTYLSIIDEMLERSQERKEKLFKDLVQMRSKVKFNEKEKKVWGKLSTAKPFSSNLEDYYQKVKSGEFLDKPIKVKRTEKLKEAERKIENEIRRFERKLQKIMSAEDYKKLKQYRLIGNLITVSDVQNPKNMFKTKSDLEKDVGEKAVEKETGKEYISASEFYRRAKEAATVEYDTMDELEDAKKEVEKLVEKMRKQGNEDVVKQHQNLLRQVRQRRTTEKKKTVGQELETQEIIDINDVEKYIKRMLKKDYDSSTKLKQDKQRLDKLVKRYKKDDDDAEKNLDEIKFLFDRLDRKMAGFTEK